MKPRVFSPPKKDTARAAEERRVEDDLRALAEERRGSGVDPEGRQSYVTTHFG